MPAPDHPSARATRLQAFVLFAVLVLASTRLLADGWWSGSLFDAESPLFYQAGTLAFNYLEFGAVRRGLGGTIAHLLADDMLVATVRFHLLGAAAVASGVAVMWGRLAAPLATRAAFAIVAIAIMLRWAEDAGRTDMVVASLFAWAAFLMRTQRIDAATGLVCIGVFVHESSLIFGLPLLLALVMQAGGWQSLDRARRLRAAVILVVTVAAWSAMALLPRAGTQEIADAVRLKFMPHEYVDWAIYFALSGMRGVETSICQNLTDPSYLVHPFGGAVVMLVVYFALRGRVATGWACALVAAVPPFIFMSTVANDIARWTMFGAFNLWLLAASGRRPASRMLPGAPPGLLPAALALALALAVVPLTHPKGFRIEFPIYAGSPAIEWVARKLGSPRTPSVQQALARCDANWREDVLGSAPDR